ncbi:MAG TPA: response regulator [Thermoanaerobaculia bacterium]|jgi:CheY-like chemotaxis protein|nr:response regulator [Thermoanaerobaculia bacterium]
MKTVLVVDDEPTVRFALAEGLTDRRRGIKVATAASGLEAITVLESERVDLVLTDLRMPDMDGFELLAHLRRNFAGLPVIVMTALGGSETAARLDGAMECFTKPFNVPVLKAKIRELLGQRVKGRVENITLPSFLQLLELERKTCTLAITSLGRAGGLFFRGGRLVGAATGELSGQAAALEIVTWEDADIEILDVCPPVETEIGAGLSYLLMEGMRLQDERENGQMPYIAAPPATGESRPGRRRRPELDTLGPMAEALKRGRSIKGALGLVLVDTETGAVADSGSFSERLELGAEMAAAVAELLREQRRAVRQTGGSEALEEILLTTSDRYYMARGLGTNEDHFLLLVLDRHQGNLARAQLDLVSIERALEATKLGTV